MKLFNWLIFGAIVAVLSGVFFSRHDDGILPLTAEADLPRLDEACHPGKPTLVVFTAEWCGYCKVLKEQTFGDPAVKTRLKNYVITYVDVEAKENRGLARAAGITSLPTTFALSRTCETKGKLEGAYPPDEFLKWLDQTEK
jgi:thiol:disulfide interchange protein